MDRFGRSTGGASSSLSITMLALDSAGGAASRRRRSRPRRRRRSRSSAALARRGRDAALGVGAALCRARTPCRSRSSVDQHATGLERRRAQRFAGAQAEAGVVPRAAHRVADHQPFGERTAVVGAGRRRSRRTRRRGARAAPRPRRRGRPASCRRRACRSPRPGSDQGLVVDGSVLMSISRGGSGAPPTNRRDFARQTGRLRSRISQEDPRPRLVERRCGRAVVFGASSHGAAVRRGSVSRSRASPRGS